MGTWTISVCLQSSASLSYTELYSLYCLGKNNVPHYDSAPNIRLLQDYTVVTGLCSSLQVPGNLPLLLSVGGFQLSHLWFLFICKSNLSSPVVQSSKDN